MRLAKAHFIGVEHNLVHGVAAVTLSVFVFAYSTRFGPISILAFYACWMPLVLIDYRRALGNCFLNGWIVALAVLACLSTFWSLAPSVSARGSVQYATHVFCALLAARVIGVRTLTFGMLTGCALVLAFSFAFGGYHYDPLDGTYSFVGAFASKNQLGFFASLGVYFAIVAALMLRTSLLPRLAALPIGAVSAYALAQSQSATSILSLGLTLGLLAAVRVLLAFAPRMRRIVLAFGFLIAFGGVTVALNAGLLDAVLGAFGKDSTLTGRTYLWSEGLAAMGNWPLIGAGYQAYWVQGFSEAERLWAEFYIASRTGFHFHNTYIEILVELGLAGCLFFIVLLVGTLAGHLRRLLDRRFDESAYALFGVVVLLTIRSFVEVDVLYPYTVGAFLLYYAAGHLALLRRSEARTRTVTVPARRFGLSAAGTGAP